MEKAGLQECASSSTEQSVPKAPWRRAHSLGIMALFFFAAVYVHQLPRNCPTPLSRLDLLHAVFNFGDLKIDHYDNTPDKATREGHTYSDKAPGTVALALPPFAAAALILKALNIDLDSPAGWLASSWIACAGSIALISALGAALLFRWLGCYAAPRAALLATLALFLGAAPLPYATMMFSHSLVVACVAIALYAIQRTADAGRAAPNTPGARPSQLRLAGWPALAGLACGWALASEYTAGIVVVALFLWLISHGIRHAAAFCLAALPPLLLIPLYSWLCFGDPFTLPYSLNESFPAMREGLYAIKWPDPQTAYNLLLSPTRGLFFWTPFLAIALVGYWDLAKGDRRLFLLAYAVPLIQILVISGRVWDWTAGPTLGPRYLAPILPLLALPCALGVMRFPKIGLALALVSIGLTAFATAVNASPEGSIYNPLTELHWPDFVEGNIQPNLGALLGLSAWVSITLYLAAIFAGCAWLYGRPGPPRRAAPP